MFGDPDTAMPLLKQLIYEQCNKECRQAITPYKSRGLEVWMKLCRDLGGPLSNAGLAAAVMQMTQRRGNSKSNNCFACGQPGHIKKQCPQRQGLQKQPQRMPGLCPKCKKGNHWANECRSVKDVQGQPIHPSPQSKNWKRGPQPQGPQIYGAVSEGWPNLNPPVQWRHPEGQLREVQALTSVPPPESY